MVADTSIKSFDAALVVSVQGPLIFFQWCVVEHFHGDDALLLLPITVSWNPKELGVEDFGGTLHAGADDLDRVILPGQGWGSRDR